jgi:trans-aconitate methyltransferase
MSLHDWLTAARADADELRERILTGYKAGKPFTPYVPTIVMPWPLASALDFGCGLGRNFPYLTSVARRVDGFDLPPMIERCRDTLPGTSVHLTADWDDVRQRRYDLVFASLVLQHIEPDACNGFLADFSRLAPYSYVLTRGSSDFDVSILELVADCGLFEVEQSAIVEHDADTHQLRQVATVSFEEARSADPSAHFDLLLRSRA